MINDFMTIAALAPKDWIIIAVVVVLTVAAATYTSLKKTAGKKRPFKIQADLREKPMPSFEINIKGALKNREDQVFYTIKMLDFTNAVEHRIQSEIGQLNEDETEVTIKSPPISMSKQTVLNEWTKVITIPAEKIKLGRAGQRNIQFKVQVNDLPATAICSLHYVQPDKGFLDIEERLEDIYASIFYMACGLRSYLQDAKAMKNTVREWLMSTGEVYPTEKQARLADTYQRIIMDDDQLMGWEDACEHYSIAIRKYADHTIRQQMIQLFFQLLETAPKSISELDRLEILFTLCKSTGSDMGQFCRMAERAFPDSYPQLDSDKQLGIHPDMGAKEVNQRLRDEYKTWNSRATHANKKIRKQAEQMLELIAAKRVNAPTI